ncbi:MAG: hypothetical protein RSB20_03150 [Clostridia bacterium]
MKKKYSPFSLEDTYQFPRIITAPIVKFLSWYFRRDIKVIYSEPLPDEPCIICPNHAMEFGPIAMQACHNHMRKSRMFTHANMILARTIPKHAMKDIFPNKKGLSYAFFYTISLLISPLMSGVIKCLEPIPVTHDAHLILTLKKASQTISEGKDVIIFPESNIQDMDKKYVNILQKGTPFIVRNIMRDTKINPYVVPAYVCKSLKTVIYGTPFKLCQSDNFKNDVIEFNNKIATQIELLASALPLHKVTHYDNSPRVEIVDKNIK